MIKDQKGQSLTEFALLVPLFLLLLCGIVDFGRLMYAYLHLNMAAQESVRMGGLGKSDDEITGFAKGYVHIGNASALTVTITPRQASRKPGDYVTVKLACSVPFLTPVVANLLPKPVVTANSTIRVE